GEVFGVVLDAEKVALVLAVGGAAISGPNGIDKNEIGKVEPGRLVVDQAGRRTLHLALGRNLDRFGPESAEMEIGPCGRRPAVEPESDGTLVVARLPRIGDIEDGGDELALLIAHGERSGGRGVAERLAGESDGVASNRGWRQEIRGNLVPGLRLGLRLLA